MSLFNQSAWNFGHEITESNQNISFSELGDPTELQAVIPVTNYTLGEFVEAVASAMNSVSAQEYTVSLDRSTRLITISAAGNFELLPQTGVTTATSAYPLMGFTTDRTGSNSYLADTASGSQYVTQYFLQNYVDFKDDVSANRASRNISTSGDIIETVSFGEQKRMSCVIRFITDNDYGFLRRVSENGRQEARDFLNYAKLSRDLEFIPDINDTNTFTKCILERTPQSQDATRFTLDEFQEGNILGLFSTGRLTFLQVR